MSAPHRCQPPSRRSTRTSHPTEAANAWWPHIPAPAPMTRRRCRARRRSSSQAWGQRCRWPPPGSVIYWHSTSPRPSIETPPNWTWGAIGDRSRWWPTAVLTSCLTSHPVSPRLWQNHIRKWEDSSSKIISGDSQRSENAQTHTYNHTIPYMKFKLKLLQIKCHILEFTKDKAQNASKIIRVFVETFIFHDRHTLFTLEASGPTRTTYTCKS
jgi:hypothetical protein